MPLNIYKMAETLTGGPSKADGVDRCDGLLQRAKTVPASSLRSKFTCQDFVSAGMESKLKEAGFPVTDVIKTFAAEATPLKQLRSLGFFMDEDEVGEISKHFNLTQVASFIYGLWFDWVLLVCYSFIGFPTALYIWMKSFGP